MIAVFDTNVLVSALWTPSGKASAIVNAALSRKLSLCHDYRIMDEYREVLLRPKFKFLTWQVCSLLDAIEKDGISVVAPPLPEVPFPDETDRMFYEVAMFCHAPLVTGNLKHFPREAWIMGVADFYEMFRL